MEVGGVAGVLKAECPLLRISPEGFIGVKVEQWIIQKGTIEKRWRTTTTSVRGV